jgi:hypothetical protein
MKIDNSWIEFDNKEHCYKDRETGKILTSVSTINSQQEKPALKFWAADEAVKYMGWSKDKDLKILENRFEEIKKLSNNDYYNELDKARREFSKIGDRAKNAGTIAHEWIQKYISAQINNDKIPTELPENEEAKNAINAFLKWVRSKEKIEWISTELIVGSKEHSLGGTIDWIAVIDGFLILGDWKTNKKLSRDVVLQMSAYWKMVDEMLEAGEKRPEKMLAVRLDKTTGDFEELEVELDEFYWESFLHLREFRRWNSYIEGEIKNGLNIY